MAYTGNERRTGIDRRKNENVLNTWPQYLIDYSTELPDHDRRISDRRRAQQDQPESIHQRPEEHKH